MTKVDHVAKLLQRLSALCDTGYALAVHIRFTRPTLLYRTYDQAWIDAYSEGGYMLSDPVVHWGIENTGTVAWAELGRNDPAGVLRRALDFGLTNGVTYATGDAASRTITGFTKSGPAFTDAELAEAIAITDEIHALTQSMADAPDADLDLLRQLP